MFAKGLWCCIGDFNAILYAAAKQSTCPPSAMQMEEFRCDLEENGLADLGYRGFPFTWTNRRLGEANTRLCLDRAVANIEWKSRFSDCLVTHLGTHASDHLPLLMQTKMNKVLRGGDTRSFKFEENWLMLDECEKVVEEAWVSGGRLESALVTIKEKKKKNVGPVSMLGAHQRRNLRLGKLKSCKKGWRNYFMVIKQKKQRLNSWRQAKNWMVFSLTKKFFGTNDQKYHV